MSGSSTIYSRVITGAGFDTLRDFRQWRRFDQWRHSWVSKFDTINWYFYRFLVPLFLDLDDNTVPQRSFCQTVSSPFYNFLIQLMEELRGQYWYLILLTWDIKPCCTFHVMRIYPLSLVYEQYHGSFHLDWILGLVVELSTTFRCWTFLHVMLLRMPVQASSLFTSVCTTDTIQLYLTGADVASDLPVPNVILPGWYYMDWYSGCDRFCLPRSSNHSNVLSV